MPLFTLSTLRSILGQTTYERGKTYFERGRVLSFECVSDEQIDGTVAGSRRRPYSVTVNFELRPDKSFEWIEGECTCPVGFNCKHVAAIMLAARNSSPQLEAALNGNLPNKVESWLEQWPKTIRASGSDGNRDAIKPSRDQLFYVFGIDQQGRASIEPYKAYLKQNGMIGKNASRFLGIGYGYPEKFMTVTDVATLAKLEFYHRFRSFGEVDWPDGDECLELVQSIVDTRRARDKDIRGATLRWGPIRRVQLVWSGDKQGTQRISGREENGEPVRLLSFPMPVYVNPTTGECGPAESGLPCPVLRWLASAPPTPAQASSEVAQRLSQLGRDIPVPNVMHIEERTSLKPLPMLKLYAHTKDYKRYPRDRYYQYAAVTETRTYPCARLEVQYEGSEKPIAIGDGKLIEVLESDRVTVIRRDLDAEVELRRTLEEVVKPYGGAKPLLVHREYSVPEAIEAATIVLPPIIHDAPLAMQKDTRFSLEALPQFRAEGWEIEMDKTWPFHMYEGPLGFSTSAKPLESDWFSFSLNLEADGQTLDLTDTLLQLIAQVPVNDEGAIEEGFDVLGCFEETELFFRLDDGRRVAFNGARLAPFIEAFLEVHGLVGFHRAEAGRVAELVEALEGSGAAWRGGPELLALGKRLRRLVDTPEVPVPASLHAELRPYQLTSYGWLRAVFESRFGGVLADDMGLGKTVQTLALIAERHLEARVDRPSLVIVPTSLIGTWQREAAKFTPNLSLLILHGPERRQRFAEIPKHHLVITTYPLVNRDHEALFAQEYEVAVLDEAQ